MATGSRRPPPPSARANRGTDAGVASVPLLSSRLLEPLASASATCCASSRAGDDLLVPGRRDAEAESRARDGSCHDPLALRAGCLKL